MVSLWFHLTSFEEHEINSFPSHKTLTSFKVFLSFKSIGEMYTVKGFNFAVLKFHGLSDRDLYRWF